RALGCIYWRTREPQKALKQFTYAIRVAPREVSAYINRAEIYVSAKQWDKARSDLDQAMRLAGRNDGALMKKARAIMAMLPRR
ncbi:MAG: tetratricopeptide repeat protein, partial [Myxococcota bacterium]